MSESAAMLEIRKIRDANSLRYLNMSNEEIKKELDESTKVNAYCNIPSVNKDYRQGKRKKCGCRRRIPSRGENHKWIWRSYTWLHKKERHCTHRDFIARPRPRRIFAKGNLMELRGKKRTVQNRTIGKEVDEVYKIQRNVKDILDDERQKEQPRKSADWEQR